MGRRCGFLPSQAPLGTKSVHEVASPKPTKKRPTVPSRRASPHAIAAGSRTVHGRRGLDRLRSAPSVMI
jgi:hypothetical protein